MSDTPASRPFVVKAVGAVVIAAAAVVASYAIPDAPLPPPTTFTVHGLVPNQGDLPVADAGTALDSGQ